MHWTGSVGRVVLVVGLAMSLLALPSWGDAPTTKIGKKIDNFTLKDSAGQPRSLADFKDKKAVVVLFLGTACPINNAFLPRLNELHETYRPKDVQVVAINSNHQDSTADVAEHVKEYGIQFPVLKDDGNKVADQFGAARTPEAFILDGERIIRYNGRIDDQFGIRFKRAKPTRKDLEEALDEILAGKAVSQPTTEVAGCLIGRAPKPKSDAKVTWTGHVAAILQKHCQECHRPGQIGPMPLLSYDDASAWADTIREVVQAKRMPPWYADPQHGKFANDRSLPAADCDLLLAWIEQGCPKGSGDEPAPKNFAEGWRIGQPDAVVTMPEPFKVAAKAPRGIRYQYFIVPTEFAEDKWIQAVEAKPGNKSVVHHILVYVREKGKLAGNDRTDGIADGLLVAFAPGDLPSTFPVGKAKKLPKDGLIIFQMHYTPSGVEAEDRSSVGLIFAKEPPPHEVQTRAVANQGFAIPANESSHKVTSTSTIRKDAVLLSLFPHMHLRGKSFEFRAVFPDGRAETLLSVPKYNFDWQNNYYLAQPLSLPAGTKIECTAYFDNSKDNPNNPDPTKPVRWGEQTWEEMMIGFMDYYYVEKGEK